MKIIVFTVLLAGLYISGVAQHKTDAELYKYKIKSYSKLKTNGVTMGTIGGGLTAAGIFLVSNGEWEEQNNGSGTTYHSKSSEATGGLVLLMVGIPLTITGFILGSIGHNKVKHYKNKLNNVNVGYYQHNKFKGVTMAMRF